MGRREHLDRLPQVQPVGLDIKSLQRELTSATDAAPSASPPRNRPRATRFMIGRLLRNSSIHKEITAAYEEEGVQLRQPPALVYVNAEAARLAVSKHFSVSTNTHEHTAALLNMVEKRFGAKSKYLYQPIPIEIGAIRLKRRERRSHFSHDLSLELISDTTEQKHAFNELRFQRRDLERVIAGNENVVPPVEVTVLLGSLAVAAHDAERLRGVNVSLADLMPVRAELGPVRVISLS